jgi:pimeloyl-ACP methyl ester carboxylesterase
VTSDDSMLYHSLSRASSLGDDNQFQDVKEMVNMRLIAIKQSLPDVPNFKMPSLQKLHATRPFTMLNTLHSNEALDTTASRPSNLERESSSMIKDGTTVLDDVLDELTGDIVIMGGLRGSVLRSAEPPYQQYWAPVKVGLNMRKVNLEVGLDDEDEERMEETIIPSGMLTHMGPVDMSRKLFKKLRASNNARTGKLRVWNYGWDWRLSPALSSRKLQEFLAGLPSNKPGVPAESRGALIIAHSTGGLITRHAVNERPELFSGVLFAGVPQRCINILGPLRNGDVVLLNEKLLSAHVNFSMRTSFVFLPEDGFCFVDKNTGESYPVDFYDPQEWVKWRLSPCLAPALPALNRPQQPASSSPSLSSFLPSSLRSRSDSKGGERRWGGVSLDPTSALSSVTGKDRTIAPQLHTGATDAAAATPPPSPPLPTDPERERNLEYLTRTLAATRKFRAEMVHSVKHQADNRYPPLAVLYGKSTPTVYASQVNGREGIPCADAYDDLLFRPGDGVVLAKEAMLPDGYAIVKGGRVSTKNGHITMLGDLGAVGKALEALVRGRNKGIGMGGKLE